MAFSAAASLHAGLYRPIAEVRRQRAGILGLLGSGLHLRAKPGRGQLSKLGNYSPANPSRHSNHSHRTWDGLNHPLASPEATNTGLTAGW